MSDYLNEAFEYLNKLQEEAVPLDTKGIEDLAKFDDDAPEETVSVIDPEMTDDEQPTQDYTGKVILDCDVCHSLMYANPEDVEVDETGVANAGKECPNCLAIDGFHIVGQVEPYCTDCKEETEAEATDDDKDEGLGLAGTLIGAGIGGLKGATIGLGAGLAGNAIGKGLASLAKNEDAKETLYAARTDKRVPARGRDYVETSLTKAQMTEMGFVPLFASDDRQHLIMGDRIRAYAVRIDNDPINEDLSYGELSYIENLWDDYSSTLDDVATADDIEEFVETEFSDYSDEDKKDIVRQIEIIEQDKIDNESCKKKTSRKLRDEALSDIDKYQKWIDYDMKHYGRISKRTNDFVKKAGLQIIKDQYGDYEVTAGKYDEAKHRELRYEDFTRAEVETENSTVEMTTDDDGKVTVTTHAKDDKEEPVIGELSDEVKEKILDNDEDTDIDVDFDEVEEESFSRLAENYFTKVYNNVKSFKTKSIRESKNRLVVEGLIRFNSGRTAPTQFVFEAKRIAKNGKVKFLGENKTVSKIGKPFILSGEIKDNTLKCESLRYNHRAMVEGKSTRKTGTVYCE